MQSIRKLRFRSALFAIEPGEDSKTNPGIFGRALATWLASRLAESGYVIQGLMEEDFGHLVRAAHPQFGLYVACSNVDDKIDEWQVFAIAESDGISSLLAWRKKRIASDLLLEDVERILRKEAGISKIRAASENGGRVMGSITGHGRRSMQRHNAPRVAGSRARAGFFVWQA